MKFNHINLYDDDDMAIQLSLLVTFLQVDSSLFFWFCGRLARSSRAASMASTPFAEIPVGDDVTLISRQKGTEDEVTPKSSGRPMISRTPREIPQPPSLPADFPHRSAVVFIKVLRYQHIANPFYSLNRTLQLPSPCKLMVVAYDKEYAKQHDISDTSVCLMHKGVRGELTEWHSSGWHGWAVYSTTYDRKRQQVVYLLEKLCIHFCGNEVSPEWHRYLQLVAVDNSGVQEEFLALHDTTRQGKIGRPWATMREMFFKDNAHKCKYVQYALKLPLVPKSFKEYEYEL